MFTIIENNKKDVFFVGDIHGEFKSIKNWILTHGLKDCILIFCGDFGLGFSKIQNEIHDLKKSNEVCEERNIDCYAVRGNHDDPSYYNEDPQKLNLSRFKTVSDYTVIQTPEHNILCVGGAVSIDRVGRQLQYHEDVETLTRRKHYTLEKAKEKARLYWWEKENFVFNKTIIDEITKHGTKIDVVVTHSSPNFAQPTTKSGLHYWTRLDPALDEDLTKERQDMADMYHYLKENGHPVTHWFYGHFHQHYFDIIEDTKFTGLDMGRASKEGSYPGGVFDVAEMR